MVIVISHDDHYFDAADKFLVMNDGVIKVVEPQTLDGKIRSAMSMLSDQSH